MREQRYVTRPDKSIVYEKITLPVIGDYVAVIDDDQLAALPEYSTTNPTGVFDNKMWRRRIWSEPDTWWVCEYVPSPDNPAMCRTNVHRAASPEAVGLVAEGVLWWLGGS